MTSILETPADPATDARGRRAARPVRFGVTDALTLLIGMIPFGVVVGITAVAVADHRRRLPSASPVCCTPARRRWPASRSWRPGRRRSP